MNDPKIPNNVPEITKCKVDNSVDKVGRDWT